MNNDLSINKVSNPLLQIHKLISRYTREGSHLPGAEQTRLIALDILKPID